jgi:hypothetical protein
MKFVEMVVARDVITELAPLIETEALTCPVSETSDCNSFRSLSFSLVWELYTSPFILQGTL